MTVALVAGPQRAGTRVLVSTPSDSSPKSASRRQTVVVAGASGGIGRATAELFATRGANVALLARGETGLDAAADPGRRKGGGPLPIAGGLPGPAARDGAAHPDATRARPPP